jgi:hypothetical protein
VTFHEIDVQSRPPLPEDLVGSKVTSSQVDSDLGTERDKNGTIGANGANTL